MEFYTAEEVANMLKLDVTTVRTHIREGKMPAYKIGRAYRIDKNEFKEYMDERRKEVEQ